MATRKYSENNTVYCEQDKTLRKTPQRLRVKQDVKKYFANIVSKTRHSERIGEDHEDFSEIPQEDRERNETLRKTPLRLRVEIEAKTGSAKIASKTRRSERLQEDHEEFTNAIKKSR